VKKDIFVAVVDFAVHNVKMGRSLVEVVV